MNRGTMGVNSLSKTVTRQRRGCDLNPGPSAPESSTLTTRLPSHPITLRTAIPVYFTCLLRGTEETVVQQARGAYTLSEIFCG